MRFFDAWRQAADQIRNTNMVIFGNGVGAIPREAVAESVAPFVPGERRTREDQYRWAKDVIERGIREGKIC